MHAILEENLSYNEKCILKNEEIWAFDKLNALGEGLPNAPGEGLQFYHAKT